MTRPLSADTPSMDTCDSWKCPGCGALVVLPVIYPQPVDVLGERKMDQLARASCGCWVASLSEQGVTRLLEAIVGFDEDMSDRRRAIAGRAG
jgi:hypothetical protein